MKHKNLLAAALCAALVLSVGSCSFLSRRSDDHDSDYYEDISSDEVSPSDVETDEYGNEEVGWLTLDSGFHKWYDPDAPATCVQYAKSPYDIYSMNYYDTAEMSAQIGMEFNANIAAQVQYMGMEEEQTDGTIEKLTAARVKLGDYDAYQVYCHYPNDNQYLVIWFMDSPDATKVYYLSAEFLDTDMDFFDYAETYRMPE